MRAYIRQVVHSFVLAQSFMFTPHRAVAVAEQARIAHPGLRHVEDLPAAKLVVHDLQACQFEAVDGNLCSL